MKNKIIIIRIILFILLIVTFNLIFGFSSQDGETSSGLSKKITEIVTKNINSIQTMDINKKEIMLNKIEHIIRKLAHFSIYTSVGILLICLMYTYKINNTKRVSLSLVFGIIYAITDEFHQYFTPGRSPLIADVLIDSLGVTLGVTFIILFKKLIFISKYFKERSS